MHSQYVILTAFPWQRWLQGCTLQYGLQGPYLHHCSVLPPASDGFEYMEFLLWVPNLHGQFYLLFLCFSDIFLSQG